MDDHHHPGTDRHRYRNVLQLPPTSSSATPARSFDSYLQLFQGDVTPDDIEIPWGKEWYVVACPGSTGRPCRDCGYYPPHLDQIVVAIDGACRSNGLPNAAASVGVAFGPESRYNLSERIKEGPFTSQRAELTAARRALQQIVKIRRAKGVGPKGSSTGIAERIDDAVIKSDSAYVVKGLTEWVGRWEANGYRTSRGTRVENADLFQELVRAIRELRQEGVQISFWQVPRSFNQDADELANRALGYVC